MDLGKGFGSNLERDTLLGSLRATFLVSFLPRYKKIHAMNLFFHESFMNLLKMAKDSWHESFWGLDFRGSGRGGDSIFEVLEKSGLDFGSILGGWTGKQPKS